MYLAYSNLAKKNALYYYAMKKMARRVLIFNFGGISNSGLRARHISVVD